MTGFKEPKQRRVIDKLKNTVLKAAYLRLRGVVVDRTVVIK